jgi:SAM-dependent methyltransferase
MHAPKPDLFHDAGIYERGMGAWSRLAGDVFLDWLSPPGGLSWLDVGCGNGAFTERLVADCAPRAIHGIDPSPAQIAYARARLDARPAVFHEGDATALPFDADSFDAAVMALALFFVPDPAKSVREMVRVVRPGGVVASYTWDWSVGGSPLAPIAAELHALGIATPDAPNLYVGEAGALRDLWTQAGLIGVELQELAVKRSFATFDDFWTAMTGTGWMHTPIADLAPPDLARLQKGVRVRLGAKPGGPVAYEATANAVQGVVPER